MKKRKGLWLGRTLRFAAWALLAAVAIAGVAAALINMLVTPERLRSTIIAQLEDSFHRPVSVAKVNLLLHQGVKVTGLVVKESPDFPGEVFLSSEFLIAKFRLWPLLFGRAELSKVLLMSPRISLIRRADGVWNIAGMLQPSQEASRSERARFLPPLQVADRISIERGLLQVRDMRGGVNFSISEFQLLVRDLHPDRPFSVEASFVNDNDIRGARVRARVELKAQVGLGGGKPQAGFIMAERCHASVDEGRFTLSGSLQDLASPRLDLKLGLPRLESSALSRYFSVPPGIDVPPSQWQVKTAVAAVPAGSPGREYRLERVEVAAGPLRLIASGVLIPGGESRLTLSLPPTKLEKVAALYTGLAERHVTGTASGSLTLAGGLPHLQPDKMGLSLKSFSAQLRAARQRIVEADASVSASNAFRTVDFKASRGTYLAYGNSLSNIVLDAGVQDGDLAVSKLETTWNGSRVRLRGCVKDVADPKEVTVAGSVDKLRVDQTLAAIESVIEQRKAEQGRRSEAQRPWAQVFKYSIPATFPDFKGRLSVARAYSPHFNTQNLDLVWDLKGISKGLKEVGGQFGLSFGPGRVSDIPAVRGAHRLLNVLLLPYVYMHELNAKAVFSLDTATPKTLDFNHVRADFGVAKGLVDVRLLQVHSDQVSAYADGGVDLPAEKLDLRVLMRLPRQRGQLPDRMVDTQGRPSLELYLKEDLNKPTPALTMRKMGANDIEEALANGVQRVRRSPLPEKLDCGRKS